MTPTQHGGAWLMVALLYGLLTALSIADGLGGGDRFLAVALPATVERALADQMRPARRRGWEVHPALAGLPPGRLGFDRDDDVDPVWVLDLPEGYPSGTLAGSSTSRNPIRTCLIPAGRPWRAAGRQTPQPLSSQEPPLTMKRPSPAAVAVHS